MLNIVTELKVIYARQSTSMSNEISATGCCNLIRETRSECRDKLKRKSDISHQLGMIHYFRSVEEINNVLKWRHQESLVK